MKRKCITGLENALRHGAVRRSHRPRPREDKQKGSGDRNENNQTQRISLLENSKTTPESSIAGGSSWSLPSLGRGLLVVVGRKEVGEGGGKRVKVVVPTLHQGPYSVLYVLCSITP